MSIPQAHVLRMSLPSAKKLKEDLEKANQAKKAKIKGAVTKVLIDFEVYLTARVNDPSRYTSQSYWSTAIPIEGYDNDFKPFFEMLNDELEPLGYKTSRTHDGGGMYDVVGISW